MVLLLTSSHYLTPLFMEPGSSVPDSQVNQQ